MPSVFESLTQTDGINPALAAGLRTISDDETIRFTQHVRYVLPLDGYVFWLAVQETAIQGSLHVTTNKQQREDETIAVGTVVFTTTTPVQHFQEIAPDTIWVGSAAGLKFAFSRAGPFYQSAKLFHYQGDAVYPALESQLLDIGAQPSPKTLIVSNSLPAWLRLKSYSPVWLTAPNPAITLYPSFAVPDNVRPPYGSIHIAPDATRSWQAAPLIGRMSSHHQLATDRVAITLYGLMNEQALAFIDLVNQYSMDTNTIGMTGEPIVRDGKRTQAELGILAMQKLITYDVSYTQYAMQDVARQLIESMPIAVTAQPYVVKAA
jgi:hypothetical protein